MKKKREKEIKLEEEKRFLAQEAEEKRCNFSLIVLYSCRLSFRLLEIQRRDEEIKKKLVSQCKEIKVAPSDIIHLDVGTCCQS